MTLLPITHMTLYKHGVGFFERRVSLAGTEVSLTFRVEEMNDILKSLTACLLYTSRAGTRLIHMSRQMMATNANRRPVDSGRAKRSRCCRCFPAPCG